MQNNKNDKIRDTQSLFAMRDILDIIDKQIVCLFEQRLNIVLDIAELKKIYNMPLRDLPREEVVKKQCFSHLKNKKYEKLVEDLYSKIIEISLNLQNEVHGEQK